MLSHTPLHDYFCRVWYFEPLLADHPFLISTFLNSNSVVFPNRGFCRLPNPPMSTPRRGFFFYNLQTNVSLKCHVPAESILVSLNFYRHNLPKLFEHACQTLFVDAFVQMLDVLILFYTSFHNIFLMSHSFFLND